MLYSNERVVVKEKVFFIHVLRFSMENVAVFANNFVASFNYTFYPL